MTSFQTVTLDTRTGDSDAVLVMRGGRLSAVLSRLSDLHEEIAGEWFVEAFFADGGGGSISRQVFASPDEFVAWAEERSLFADAGLTL